MFYIFWKLLFRPIVWAFKKEVLSILRGVRFLLTQWDAYLNSILQCVVQGNQPGLGQHIGGSHSRACGPTRQYCQGPRAGGNVEGQLSKMHWISLTTLGEAVHQMMKNDNTIIVSKCLMRIFQVATWLQIWCIWMGVQTRGENIQISVGFYFHDWL